MFSSDQSGQSIGISIIEAEVILKALGFYQVHLFDEFTKQKTQSLKEEISQTTMLIKKMHKFQEDQGKSSPARSKPNI